MNQPVYAVDGLTGTVYHCEEHVRHLDAFYSGSPTRLLNSDDTAGRDQPQCEVCLLTDARGWSRSWQNY